MAPELIKGESYNSKVDIWATGVITYMLLSGVNPFPGDGTREIKRLIVESEVDFGFIQAS